MDYNEPDLTDVFCLTFDITRDIFGEIRSVPLKENGTNILVSQENKYVVSKFGNFFVIYCLLPFIGNFSERNSLIST